MAMTWAEVKGKIRDLGFEEDATMDEYSDIVIHSVNRSLDMIYNEVIQPNEQYFVNLLSTWGNVTNSFTQETSYEIVSKWVMNPPTHVNDDTEDDFEMEIPDKCVYILPVLASYYVWLDDDERKAVYYWNQWETWKANFENEIRGRNYRVTMYGGLWF